MKLIVESDSLMSRAEWMDALDLSERDWLQLLESGVVTPSGTGTYQIPFVGLIAGQYTLIASVPKFFANHEGTIGIDDVSLVTLALRTYVRDRNSGAVKPQDQGELVYSSDYPTAQYEIFLSLLRWFRTYGAYYVSRREHGRSVSGRAHWPRTVAKTLPIHADNGIVYPNPISTTATDAHNDVTTLQISVLNHLYQKYGALDENHRQIPSEIQAHATLDAEELLARADAFRQRIQRELGRVFRTETIAMLQSLLAFFDQAAWLTGPPQLQLFGTTSFHVVWERACATAFGNDSDEFLPHLSQPVWNFTRPYPHKQSRGQQRPDIIARLDENIIAIIDAKYYYPIPTSLCGWPDLVKQFFYAESYTAGEDSSVLNALLFPVVSDTPVQSYGTVDLERDGASDPRFSNIRVFGVDGASVLRAYARRTQQPKWLEILRCDGGL